MEHALASAWAELESGVVGGMEGRKIIGRTEELRRDGPVLTFEIERHGAKALGSIYAEVQSWEVDLETMVTSLVGTRGRQLRRASPPWDAEEVARDIVAKLIRRRKDPRLRYHADGRLEVFISEVTPPFASKQTEVGRRSRFAEAMRSRLEPLGWIAGGRGGHTWTPPPDPLAGCPAGQ